MSELEDSIENGDRSQRLELEESIESTPSHSKHSELKSHSQDLTHPALMPKARLRQRAPLRGGDLHAEVNS